MDESCAARATVAGTEDPMVRTLPVFRIHLSGRTENNDYTTATQHTFLLPLFGAAWAANTHTAEIIALSTAAGYVDLPPTQSLGFVDWCCLPSVLSYIAYPEGPRNTQKILQKNTDTALAAAQIAAEAPRKPQKRLLETEHCRKPRPRTVPRPPKTLP